MELEPERQYQVPETFEEPLNGAESVESYVEPERKRKRKNDDNQNDSGVSIQFVVKRSVGGVIVAIIIYILLKIVFPDFDLPGLHLDIPCLINFGNCTNNDAGEVVSAISTSTLIPTSTPPLPTHTPTVQPATFAPPIVAGGDCTKPGLPTVQTDRMKLTVNSIDIRQTNIDLNTMFINVTVENLTNSDLKLPLQQNLRILQSQPSNVIAAPIVEMSNWQDDISASSKLDQTIKLAQISMAIPFIDIEFMESMVNGVAGYGIRVSGIPSTCP